MKAVALVRWLLLLYQKRCCIPTNATPYKTKATPGFPPIRVREAPGGLNDLISTPMFMQVGERLLGELVAPLAGRKAGFLFEETVDLRV